MPFPTVVWIFSLFRKCLLLPLSYLSERELCIMEFIMALENFHNSRLTFLSTMFMSIYRRRDEKYFMNLFAITRRHRCCCTVVHAAAHTGIYVMLASLCDKIEHCEWFEREHELLEFAAQRQPSKKLAHTTFVWWWWRDAQEEECITPNHIAIVTTKHVSAAHITTLHSHWRQKWILFLHDSKFLSNKQHSRCFHSFACTRVSSQSHRTQKSALTVGWTWFGA